MVKIKRMMIMITTIIIIIIIIIITITTIISLPTEMKHAWDAKTEVIPLIIGATGTVSK